MCLEDEQQSYALKRIIYPNNWWAFWGNENTGVWHEVYRLVELKLMAEHFHRLADDTQTAIYGQYFIRLLEPHIHEDTSF
jgi:hypothetical protein